MTKPTGQTAPIADDDERSTPQGPATLAARRERLSLAAATVTVLGLAMVGTGPTDLGAAVSLAGLGGLMFAVHAYGRLGEER